MPTEGIATLPPGHPSLQTLHELDDLYHSSPDFITYVDVHLAYSPFSRSIRERGDISDISNGEGEGSRQFNVWRNVARLFAPTDFVMMLDVDFAVCTDWRTEVRDYLLALDAQALDDSPDLLPENRTLPDALNATSKRDVYKRLKGGSAALVIPVFEYANLDDGTNQETFPKSKEV